MSSNLIQSQARQKYIVMSPRKIRRVLDMIRGKSAIEAYTLLRLLPYEAAQVVLKKLIEATSNLRSVHGVDDLSSVTVASATADEGPAYRRFKPRAQGRIYRREKPTSHLTIVVRVKNK